MYLERRVVYYHLAFYDSNGGYDEDFIEPTNIKGIGHALFTLVAFHESQGEDYARLFIEYDNNTSEEIKIIDLQ